MSFRSLQCYILCVLAVALVTPAAAQSHPAPRNLQRDATAKTVVVQTGGASRPLELRLGASQSRSGGLGDATPSAPADSGTFLFLPVVTYAAGQDVDAVALADVNGDGHPDLVVVNGCLASSSCVQSGISVLLGNGDGTFQTAVSYPSGDGYATSIAIADLNGDGHPDVAVANTFGGSGGVSVLLGNGNGTFQAALSYSSGGELADSIAVGDLNGDGHPDIAVSNWASHTVGILLGNGNGTFQSVATYDAGFDPDSVAIGDLNGDGHPDLVLASLCRTADVCPIGGVSVLMGNGDGTFQPPVDYSSAGNIAFSAGIGDVNGDGYPDIAVANISCDGCGNAGVGLLLGNGDGTFQETISYESGNGANSVQIRDVNGDGHQDLVMMNSANACNYSCSGTVTLMLGNGDGTFQSPAGFSSGGYTGTSGQENGNAPNGIAVGDVNGDGKPDVAVMNLCGNTPGDCSHGGTVGVLLNNTGAPATTTTVISNVNPVNVNKAVTYTATVAKHGGGAVNGAVTFMDGINPLGTVTLAGNQAAISVSYGKSDIGPHSIIATYPGTLHKAAGSQSTTLTEYVRGATTKTVVTTSGSPSLVGQAVTFTATLTSRFGTVPDGEQVAFYDGSTALASVSLSSGIASYTTSLLSAKTHVIKAIYAGDNTFEPSAGHVTQMVELYSSTTTLGSSPNPSTFGQAVTLTATVSSSAPSGATGKVTFKSGATTLGRATLSGGIAILTTKKLPIGTLTIAAFYNGDTYSDKSTGSTTQTVH